MNRALAWVLLPLIAAGCGPEPVADTQDSDPVDTDALVDSDDDGGVDTDVDLDTLNGTPPAVALAAPEFTATNRDETLRDRDSLLGHPTVVWFYPLAGSSG